MQFNLENVESLTISQLADSYNEFAEKMNLPAVKKFSDRNSAIRRVKVIYSDFNAKYVVPMQKIHNLQENPEKEIEPVQNNPELPGNVTQNLVDPQSKTKKVRVSMFAGKFLYAIKKENPRRKSSIGWKSINIIMENPGVLYEEFLILGGRRVDLDWDFKKGNIELKDEVLK
jgi:hypothetical protein